MCPERCSSVIDYALSSVPFYSKWRVKDPGLASSEKERFAALPILTKRDLRAHLPLGFMDARHAAAKGFALGDIEIVSTSGTAEERVSVVWNQVWWDRSEREASRLHPVLDRIFAGQHKEAVLTSPVCGGNLCHVGDAPMEGRIIGGILFLNQSPDPTSWDARNIRRMAEELGDFQPDIIEADSAYLAILASACRDAGIHLFAPACIVCTYEFPSRMHYRQIGRAFPGVPIVSSYGSTEAGHVFTQCAAGTFHQNTATCHVDIQPLRSGTADPSVGRILVSTLDNPWFTLLRFDVGDLARVRQGRPCPCGRTQGIVLDAIEGRVRDLTFDTKGGVVTVKRLDDALEAAEDLTGYRLDQTGAGTYTLYFNADQGAEARTEDVLRDALHDVYGADAVLDLRRQSSITPEQSGKFRLARTALPVHMEELFR